MPIYMKYGSIKGDVTAEGFTDYIEVNSFNFGIGRGISTATGGSKDREASAPSISEIVVTKPADSASMDLMSAALFGEGVFVTIAFVKTDKGQLEMYQQYVLTNTLVSGFSQGGATDRPGESVSLNFTKFEYKFVQMVETDAAGSPSVVTYDISKAKNT